VGVPLSTRETVDCETPVASAMSRMVGALVARPPRVPPVRPSTRGSCSVLLIGSLLLA
jgi:hypothetical protein